MVAVVLSLQLFELLRGFLKAAEQFWQTPQAPTRCCQRAIWRVGNSFCCSISGKHIKFQALYTNQHSQPNYREVPWTHQAQRTFFLCVGRYLYSQSRLYWCQYSPSRLDFPSMLIFSNAFDFRRILGARQPTLTQLSVTLALQTCYTIQKHCCKRVGASGKGSSRCGTYYDGRYRLKN